MEAGCPSLVKVAETDWIQSKGPGFKGISYKTLISKKQTDGFTLEYSQAVAGGEVPIHRHPFEMAYFFISGQGIVQIGDRSTTIEPGLVAYAGPNVPHGLRNTGDEPLIYLEIKCPSQY